MRSLNLRATHFLPMILALFVVAGCSKKKDDPVTPPAPGGGGNPPAADHAQFTLDGQLTTFTGGNWGVGAHASGSGSNNGLYQEAQGTVIMNGLTGLPPAIFYYRVKVFDQTGLWGYPTLEQINAMFDVQAYPFGQYHGHHNDLSLSELQDGVVVVYIDANGVEWASDKGVADQTGSSFNIVQRTPVQFQLWHAVVKATFTCKLYDGDGNMMQLTSGSIQGPAVAPS